MPANLLEALAGRFDSANGATEFADLCECNGFPNEALYRIAQSAGDSPNFALGLIASALTVHAGALMKKREGVEARHLLEAAIRLQPRHPFAWAKLAIVAYDMEDQKTAEYWADKFLSFEPDMESEDYWESGLRATMTDPAGRKEAGRALGEDVEGDWERTVTAMREIRARTARSDADTHQPGEDPMERHRARGQALGVAGLYVVYGVFIGALVLNGVVARSCFVHGRIVLGLWSIAAIIVLPKAALGLLLLVGKDSLMWLSLSKVVYKAFPRTVHRYGRQRASLGIRGFGDPLTVAYSRELCWAIVGLLPAALWFFGR